MSSKLTKVNYYRNDSKPKYLNWLDRPDYLKQKIQESYEHIINESPDQWRDNGNQGAYNLCTIAEYRVIKKQILEEYPNRKEFFVLDLGSGFFSFVDEHTGRISSDDSLPEDITVHIIGVRGEKHSEPSEAFDIKAVKRCLSYKLGSFAIENLVDELTKINFSQQGRFDLIVSKMTSIHLLDPIGTFAQAYYLLRPKTGLYIGQGWYHLQDSQPVTHITCSTKENMSWFLQQTGAAYLMQCTSDIRAPNSFIIQKSVDDTFCKIPLSYLDLEYHGYRIQGNKSACRFNTVNELKRNIIIKNTLIEKRKKKEIFHNEFNILMQSNTSFSGSSSLFDALVASNLMLTGFGHSDEDSVVLVEEIYLTPKIDSQCESINEKESACNIRPTFKFQSNSDRFSFISSTKNHLENTSHQQEELKEGDIQSTSNIYSCTG